MNLYSQNLFSSILQEDLDKNMKIYKIVKYFRGGSKIYHALLPKSKKIKKGMLEYQLEKWGENTPDGSEEGWSIRANVVKKIPKNSCVLYFEEDFIK